MIKNVKKHDTLLPVVRFFTHDDHDAYDQIPFQNAEFYGDEGMPSLTAPLNWSSDAVALLAEHAAHTSIPVDVHAVEENTVPSWLWARRAHGSRRKAEDSVADIFNRTVGSASAKAWKLGLFRSEKHARTYFDEMRYALIQRHIALDPALYQTLGLDWAYDLHFTHEDQQGSGIKNVALTNAQIEELIAKDTTPKAAWKKIFAVKGRDATSINLQHTDINEEWQTPIPQPARATIDVLAMRHNDGSVNCEKLAHAARLLTILLDLHERPDVTISLANLAPLLLALGLGYDSEAGRALAASLASLVTAECLAVSGELAALRGASTTFTANRDAIMRTLRNHSRAANGEGNDFEKLSVTPAPLALKHCPDLALASAQQKRWADVLNTARAFGLRATHVTDLTPCPLLALFMQSATQGLEPLHALTHIIVDGCDHPHAVLHPVVTEALARLDYPRQTSELIIRHIAGSGTIFKGALNLKALSSAGIDAAALERVEAYISCVNDVRLAFTPWILGVDFCHRTLSLPLRTLEAPRFDLLSALGFDAEDIISANQICYGHGTVRNAKILNIRHRPLFACGKEVSAEARLRMAAAVQGLITGSTGLHLELPAEASLENGIEWTLATWRRGLKSVTLTFDPALTTLPERKPKMASRRISAREEPHAKAMKAIPQRSRTAKAPHTTAKRKPAERRV